MTPEHAFKCLKGERVVLARTVKPSIVTGIIDAIIKCQCCGSFGARIVLPEEWHLPSDERRKDQFAELDCIVEQQ